MGGGVADVVAHFAASFLGLASTAKHSAPVVLLSVALIGTLLAVFQPPSSLRNSGPRNSRAIKLMKIALVFAGAMVILRAPYFFRYSESPSLVESFNRPLSGKIDDVLSPRDRWVLAVMATTHVVPRAYVWGFADTIRVGWEGREIPQLFLGRVYGFRAPKYFFPVIMAVKLPIGLLVLLTLGLFLFFARSIPLGWNCPPDGSSAIGKLTSGLPVIRQEKQCR